MQKRHLSTITALTLAASLLAACGGGGGGSSSLPSTPIVKPNGKTQTAITFAIPGKKSNAARKAAVKAAPRGTHTAPQGYASRSVQSVAISFGAHGSTLPAVNAAPTFATDLTPGENGNNTTCTTAGSDGGYSCTILIAAPVGYDDMLISEWDAANGAPGATPNVPSGNVLAIWSSLNDPAYANGVAIQQNLVNTPNVQMAGVVASAQTTLTKTSMVAGSADSTVVGVTALDADGNVITGNLSWVDSSNTPVTLTVTGSPNCTVAKPCTPTGGSIGPADPTDFSALTFDFTNPSDTYTMNYSASSANSLANVTFALTATAGSPAGQLNGATLEFTQTNGTVGVPGAPQVFNYQGMNAPGTAIDIVTGSDGNVYANEGAGGFIDQAIPGSGYLTPFQIVNQDLSTPAIAWIAAGADGDVWYLDSGNNEIGKFNPSSVFGGPVNATSASLPAGDYRHIISGADGKMYVSDHNGNILRIDPQTMSVLQTFNVPNAGAPIGLANGPLMGGDKTLFYSDSANDSIGYVDLNTNGVTELSSVSLGFAPYRLVAGSDGMLYVGGTGPSMYEVNPANTGSIVNNYSLTAGVEDIGIGPDGNVWAGMGNGNLARVTIPATAGTGVVSEFGSNSGLQCSTGHSIGVASAYDSTTDSKNLWSDDTCGNVIELELP